MTHVEYIEKLIENKIKEYDTKEQVNENVASFRLGVIYGMKYVVQSLKNPIDFNEEVE